MKFPTTAFLVTALMCLLSTSLLVAAPSAKEVSTLSAKKARGIELSANELRTLQNAGVVDAQGNFVEGRDELTAIVKPVPRTLTKETAQRTDARPRNVPARLDEATGEARCPEGYQLLIASVCVLKA